MSPRRVTLWASDGMPVAEGGGRGKEARYDLAAVLAWREKRRANDPAASSVGQSKAELQVAQRRKIELELRRREGQLLERADVEREWTRQIAAAVTRLRAVPRAVAARLVDVARSEGALGVERVVATEIDAALLELAGP